MFGLVVVAVSALFATQVHGLDEDFRCEDFTGTCASGSAQSPILISTGARTSLDARRTVKISLQTFTGGVELINKGTALQVEADSLSGEPTTVPICRGTPGVAAPLNTRCNVNGVVDVVPLQFHFHTPSEHATNGVYYAAETHMVHGVPPGGAPGGWGGVCDNPEGTPEQQAAYFNNCLVVIGTYYTLGGSSPSWFDSAFDSAPLLASDTDTVQWRNSFALSNLEPGSKAHTEYYGSLTTPGCNEGVRWVVYDQTLTITPATMRKMERFMCETNDGAGTENHYVSNRRKVQDLNGRTVYSATAAHSS